MPERDHYRWPGRYGLRLGTYRGQWLMQSSFDGSFLIARDGRSIHVVCEEDIVEDSILKSYELLYITDPQVRDDAQRQTAAESDENRLH